MRKFHEVPMFNPTRFNSVWRQFVMIGMFAMLAAVGNAAPGWDSYLNYQGQLTDNSGVPVADGVYSIQFTVYDQAAAGNVVWTETQPSVTVSKGLFNVVLGSNGTLIDFSAYNNVPLWIALNVNANGEMTPRQQLLPSAFALNSKRVDGHLAGYAAGNVPYLDATGKIPAALIGAGAVTVPMDMVGSGGPYNLRVRNDTVAGVGVSVTTAVADTTGAIGVFAASNNGRGVVAYSGNSVAISATTLSTTSPAFYAESARTGAVFKTQDSVNGIALEAQGAGGGVARLFDRADNAQVYGQAIAAATYGVAGFNTAGGTGVYGNSNSFGIGVYGYNSGSGYGTYGYSSTGYGVYGSSSTSYGLYGYTTSGTGAYGFSSSGYGVQGSSNSSNGVVGISSGAGQNGVYGQGPSGGNGVYGFSSFSNGYGVQGYNNSGTGVYGFGVTAVAGVASTTNGVGVLGTSNGASQISIQGIAGATTGRAVFGQHTASGGQGYGVRGDTNSTTGVGVEGFASASGANYGVRGDVVSAPSLGVAGYNFAPSGTAVGVFGYSSSTAGMGVLGNGFIGVRGATTVPGGAGLVGTSSDPAADGIYAENSSTGAGATAATLSSTASANGIGLVALGGASSYGVSGTGGIAGVYGFSPGQYGVLGTGSTAGIEGQNFSNQWGVEGISNYGGVIGRGQNSGSTTYGVLGTADGIGGAGGYFYSNNSTGSADGVVAYAYGTGGTASGGRFYSNGSTGTIYGVYATHTSTGGAAGQFVSSGSAGLIVSGTTIGVSATTSNNYTPAFFASGNSIYGVQSRTSFINFYSDDTNSPTYGFYHYAGSAKNNSYGFYDVNSNASSNGAYIENLAPTGSTSGAALVVRGKVRMTDCSGKALPSGGGPWVINSSTPGVGTYGANCIEPTSIIQLTLGTSSGYPLYITSVGTGTFTVACNQALVSPVIYYTIIGK